MRVCVHKVRIKHSIRHLSPAIYALHPALEPHLSFVTYRTDGVTTKRVLKIIMIVGMEMFTNGRKGVVIITRKERSS
jgi:hypothetical protein